MSCVQQCVNASLYCCLFHCRIVLKRCQIRDITIAKGHKKVIETKIEETYLILRGTAELQDYSQLAHRITKSSERSALANNLSNYAND